MGTPICTSKVLMGKIGICNKSTTFLSRYGTGFSYVETYSCSRGCFAVESNWTYCKSSDIVTPGVFNNLGESSIGGRHLREEGI